MSKATERELAKIKRLERNTQMKLRRLQQKGIAARSLDPRHPVDSSNIHALKRYVKDLEKFTSRTNQYVALAGGSAVSHKMWKEYEKAYKEANKRKADWWKTWGEKPFITPSGIQQQTLAMTEAMKKFNQAKIVPFDQATKPRTIKQLEERIEVLRKSYTPQENLRKTRNLRATAKSITAFLDDVELSRRINYLTNAQLFALASRSNFQDLMYQLASDTIKGSSVIRNEIMSLIDVILEQMPSGRQR